MSDDEIIARARAVLEQVQDQALAQTALSATPDWIASGHPPARDVLRAAGFDGVERADIEQKRLARRAFVRRFGLTIPCAELVAALSPLSPLVEIGAGAGALAAMLRAAGGDVVATDPAADGGLLRTFRVPTFLPVEPLGGVAAVRAHPDRNVLCAWPSEAERWAFEAAREIAPGRQFALVSDARGITGDAALFALLAEAFEVVGGCDLPQFPNVRDQLTIYRRR
jgi:hypothetical protein